MKENEREEEDESKETEGFERGNINLITSCESYVCLARVAEDRQS